MSKASITFSIYNKEYNVLNNTICSIVKQKTTFPFEIVIIDDGSEMEYNDFFDSIKLPKHINLKYKKTEKVGFPFAKSKCIDMLDKNSNVIIMQSADIIFGNKYTLQKLYDNVKEKYYTLANVRNFKVNQNICENYEEKTKKILKEWSKKQRKDIYCDPSRKKALLFFLGAIRRVDLLNYTSWEKNSCDAVIGTQLRKLRDQNRFLPIWVKGAIGIHQEHKKIWYECPIQDTCNFKCKRTKARRNK